MSVVPAGEVLSGLVGLTLFCFFILVVLIIAFGALISLRDLLKELASWACDLRSSTVRRRAYAREERVWRAERRTAEAALLVARFDDPVGITAASVAGRLLVIARDDETILLRSLERDCGVVGGFSLEEAGGAVRHIAVSPNGEFVAAGGRGAEVGVFLADGRKLCSVAPRPSGAFEAWDATADDADGYLQLNEWLVGLALGPVGAGGAATLTAAWGYQYGPDGFPGPTFGSGAVLVRRFRLTGREAGGRPEPVAEFLHDAGHVGFGGGWGVAIAPGGCPVFVGSGRGAVLAELGEGGWERSLGKDLGRPLACSSGGGLLVGSLPDRVASGAGFRGSLVLWNGSAGERLLVADEAVLRFGPAAGVSPDGSLVAVEARERRPLPGLPYPEYRVRGTVRVYVAATGEPAGKLPVEGSLLVAFSPGGESLVTVEPGGVKIWRL
ncbi:hypothetical protein Rxycam_02757 [Rubrobacter xylanophilus DSM 9941]|uniref:hypothetical protein n=1 Tax=Rubrobacter xylanophilus TaxID=49319 RepID=UPI001C6446EA|nr:hypothetical protein [Rubrobacter xylanophilus]QYJ16921.1 hypothetical protein Rxycam_02757 [Rubrobacter xylanophilus DSM 9941]